MASPLLYALMLHFSAITSHPMCSCVQGEVSTAGISARFGSAVRDTMAEVIRPAPVDTPSAAFVGELVSIVRHPIPYHPAEPSELTFIVEMSWRGPVADTLHVLEGVGCPTTRVGETYVITGRVENGEIVMKECYSPPAYRSAWGAARLDSLQRLFGKPVWTADPVGRRSYDRVPPTPSNGGVTLAFYAGIEDGATIELVGTNQMVTGSPLDRPQRFTGLSPDFMYRLRLHQPDGSFEDHYIIPRPDRGVSGFTLAIAMYPGSTVRGLTK